MARTNRQNPTHESKSKPSRNHYAQQNRQSLISRSLSKLLRHQAQNEKIPISSQGWVRLDHLLAWKGLGRLEPPVDIEDILDAVEEDGISGKGRFALKLDTKFQDDEVTNAESAQETEGDVDIDGAATGIIVDLNISEQQIETENAGKSIESNSNHNPHPSTTTTTTSNQSKNTTETLATISHHRLNPTTPATSYFIRATQGHSMKSIESEGLLQPITLTNLNSSTNTIPNEIVHGTFHAFWSPILQTGGLKPMNRNNIHFATGPSPEQVLSLLEARYQYKTSSTTSGSGGGGSGGNSDKQPQSKKQEMDQVLSQNKVVSGMRWDAQVLIYVDIRRCLEDNSVQESMKWWRSENGVILTEGISSEQNNDNNNNDDQDKDGDDSDRRNKSQSKIIKKGPISKILPMKYWSRVIEIKNGLGVIWTHEDGIVQSLPEDVLRNAVAPVGKKGRSGGGRGRGRGGGRGGGGNGGNGKEKDVKPRLNLERDGVGVDVHDDDDDGDDGDL